MPSPDHLRRCERPQTARALRRSQASRGDHIAVPAGGAVAHRIGARSARRRRHRRRALRRTHAQIERRPDGRRRHSENLRAAQKSEAQAAPLVYSRRSGRGARALHRVARDRPTRVSASMRRIMIIEDNADNRLLLNAILGDAFTVPEPANGPDGLAALATEMPEIVLLDISLPGMEGVEVLRHIRADAAFRHLPVIAFTAHAMRDDRSKFLGHGFDDYITK